jgi:hypothetical protein
MRNCRSAHKSSKKLLEQCQKLDKIWGHVFSAVITLNAPEAWYRKLRELIDRQQQGSLWMSQTKVRLRSETEPSRTRVAAGMRVCDFT